MTTSEKKYPLIHPGEILRDELLIPHKLTAEKLAQELKVEEQVIQDLVAEKGNITADLAARLAFYFSIGSDFWVNCQRDYDTKLSEKLLNEKKSNQKLNLVQSIFKTIFAKNPSPWS